MSFQDDPDTIHWRLHLKSPVAKVYRALATDDGRARLWAESAREHDSFIHFVFPNGARWKGRILQARSPHIYAVLYFGDLVATFELADDGQGGTDLSLTESRF